MNELSSQSPKSQPTLKTPQELIHIQHKVTLRQYKYWILILRAYREAYETGKETSADGYYTLPLATVAERMGYRPSNAELRADLESIRKEPIIYNALCKDGTPAMRGAGFISTWQLSSGYIGFTLPEMLCRCVQQLDDRDSIFHLLNWSVFSTFSGKHEANLYKLCKDYVGVRRTPVFALKAFREYMGISEREYTEFKGLNRYVITDPVARINESAASDITVEVSYQREFRKVVSLQFLVQPKRQISLSWGDEPAFIAARSLIPVAQQREYMQHRSPESIKASIDRANIYVDEQTRQGKPVRNAGGIYRKAILEDWGAQQSNNSVQLVEMQRKGAEEVISRVQEVQAERVTLEESRALELAVWNHFLALDEGKKADIVEQVVGDKKLLRRQFTEAGLESVLVRKAIVQSPILKKALLER